MTAVLIEPPILRPLTDTEADAVARRALKEPVELVAEKTGLTNAEIAAAVDLSRAHAAATAEHMERQTTHTSAGFGPVTQAEPTAAENTGLRRTIGGLLTWAENSRHQRAQTLAVQIRAGLSELKQLHVAHEARTKAAADVERLAAELEAAQARLRDLGGSNGQDPATRTVRKAELAKIRDWVREQGGEVSERGQIPKTWVTAYHQAHSTSTPGPAAPPPGPGTEPT